MGSLALAFQHPAHGVAGEGGDQLTFAKLDQGAAIVVAVVAGAPVEAGVHDCWVRSS
tara:strand:- start:1340 stop:1510 length:171 start_codon:yes stop_codon:yes gene_type:complete